MALPAESSLDCVWQAVGVEHVSLHSSLASHFYRFYDFASYPTSIECSSISAFLSREYFQHKRFSAGLQTPFRLKGTDLLCEQNFGARVLIDSALWISEPRRAACLLRLFSWLQMLNTRISAIPQSAMKRNNS